MSGLRAYMGWTLPTLFFLLPFIRPIGAVASSLDVQPAVINISSFFSGAQIQVTADLPPGTQAVLRIRGKRIEAELMRKAHRWELWMNSGEVDIGNAPTLFIALSSTPGLLSPEADNLPWTYAAEERGAQFSGRIKTAEDDRIFDEFVRLKERDKLYRLYPGGLKIEQIDADRCQASAAIDLPSRIKPSTYRVALWIVRDGKVIERRDAAFDVRMQGLPKFMHALAVKHGVLYGFLAVVLAMAAGMLTGLAFHRGGH